MIRRVKEGWRVVAESGRNMGTYRSKEAAKARLAQIEQFKSMRYQHSPVKKIRGPKIVKRGGGYSVIAKSGRSMGNYRTKQEALNRKWQIEANAVKFFTKLRGYTKKQHSPGYSVMGAWNVYLNGKLIDTVFTNDTDPWQVKHSLINHDGYPSGINVRLRRKR